MSSQQQQQQKQTTAAPAQQPPQAILLRLPSSGRTLSYATYGSTLPTAPTILYFHGFPASHAEAALYHPAALRRGVRIIAPDRPGMGASTFARDRRIADWPRDALALADALGVRRFAVLGVSGGAPYALACAAAAVAPEELLRGRLVAVGVVAGLYPASLGLAGMLPDARALLWVAPWWTGLVRWALEWGLGAAAARAAEGDGGAALEEVLGRGMVGRPEADRRVWEEDEAGFRGCLVESVRGAVVGGSAEGAAHEARLFGSDWGFGLDEVEVTAGEGRRRIVLWHGALDVNSPVAMAEKAAALIGGGAELRVEPDEAHASLTVHKVEEVLDTLKDFF